PQLLDVVPEGHPRVLEQFLVEVAFVNLAAHRVPRSLRHGPRFAVLLRTAPMKGATPGKPSTEKAGETRQRSPVKPSAADGAPGPGIRGFWATLSIYQDRKRKPAGSGLSAVAGNTGGEHVPDASIIGDAGSFATVFHFANGPIYQDYPGCPAAP